MNKKIPFKKGCIDTGDGDSRKVIVVGSGRLERDELGFYVNAPDYEITRLYHDRLLKNPTENAVAFAKAWSNSRNKKLIEALESAVNGLEWIQDEHPEIYNKADEEKLQEWKQILKTCNNDFI